MSEEIIKDSRVRSAISPREIVYKYIRYLPWVIVSIIFMLLAAYIKLRYSTPVFSVSGKLFVTSQSPYGNSSEKFDDIFMMQRADKINDEIEIIKSRSVAARVIRALGLQTQIYNKGKIRSSVLHLREAPFNFEIINIADSSKGVSILVSLVNDNQFTLNEHPEKYNYTQIVTLPGIIFRLTPNGSHDIFKSNDFVVSWTPLERMSAGLSGSIGVNRVNDFTNVLNISYQTENVRLGVDIVNQYMKEYQISSLEDKREIAAKALEFIDDQLTDVIKDLGVVERNLQQYREHNRLFNQEIQTEMFFNELSENNKQLVQQGINVKVIDYLSEYLSDSKNRYKIIPSVLGINEPSLLQQVSEFNKLQLERETALRAAGGQNPTVLTLEVAIEKLRNDMIENLKNVRQTYTLALNELIKKEKTTDQAISSIPGKEKQLVEVTRQQSILQELYSYLLQKKLETSIASASTISNIKVVEPAMASTSPISPDRRGLYMIAIILGIAIPAGIIFLIEYLNDKVKSKRDIEQLTEAPILGEIGHTNEASTLVVTSKNRKFMAEQFRLVRSNLRYILPQVEKPVLLVTSSFSGEGKSFISTNLGSVLALSGKRTVILEFDIRKPKIMKGLGLSERKGITNYIVSNVSIAEIVYPVPDVEDLYVIPCGPVPPNPGEMLLDSKVNKLFEELRGQFDAIIIDSAPVGLVSDAIILSRFADATVYIIRHNYTVKKQVSFIDEMYKQKKLPHLSLIINDISSRDGQYGYGGYGYGYGYGYGSSNGGAGYFDNQANGKKKGWRKWLSKK